MEWNRRRFLAAGLVVPALAAQGSAAPLVDKGFARVRQIATGVYVTIADPSKGAQCRSNGGVIAGRDAVLIVEGHMQPEGAALEIEIARMVSKAPILAHDKVTPLMKEQYAAVKGASIGALLAPLEKKVAQAIDATDKKHKEEDLEATKRMYAAIEASTLFYPTEALTPAQLPKWMDLGGLTAILEFRPGHTPTDLNVRVPERDVVFAGDLLFHRSYPLTVDADTIARRKVLERFARYGHRTRFIPGHGPVCGVEAVREQSALFDDLRIHAEKMIRAGASTDEAERRYVVPARFQDYVTAYWGLRVGAAMRSYCRRLAP